MMSDKEGLIDREFCEEKHRLTEISFCTKVERLEGVLTTRLDGMDNALKVKTYEMDRRLEGLNELRSEVVRDRDQFARKDAIDSKIRHYDAWIMDANEKLTKLLVNYNTRITQSTILSVMAILVAIVAILSRIFLE